MISKCLHNMKKEREFNENGVEEVNGIEKTKYKLRAQEETVSHGQVENVDREGIPMHTDAQEPQDYGIESHPNQGNDDGKQIHRLVLDVTI